MGGLPSDAFFDEPRENEPSTKHLPQYPKKPAAEKGHHIPLPDDTLTHHSLEEELAGAPSRHVSGRGRALTWHTPFASPSATSHPGVPGLRGKSTRQGAPWRAVWPV